MADSEKNQPVIHIEGERASKFHSLLADIADAATSLKTASKLFPNSATISEGQMHPATTIMAFASALNDLVGDAMSIACDDDLKEVDHAQG